MHFLVASKKILWHKIVDGIKPNHSWTLSYPKGHRIHPQICGQVLESGTNLHLKIYLHEMELASTKWTTKGYGLS